MAEAEGVIQYDLDFEEDAPPPEKAIDTLNQWRTLLYQMKLIGQDDARYGGLGYGNISARFVCQRWPLSHNAFVITGTQTGQLAQLGADQYSLVTDCDPDTNLIRARGRVKPSSEALTHGVFYQLDRGIGAVIHVHCPEIWHCGEALLLPLTPSDVAYGTPQMAAAVRRLYQEGAFQKYRVLVMKGHLDGVMSFGVDIEQAGQALIAALASAIEHFK